MKKNGLSKIYSFVYIRKLQVSYCGVCVYKMYWHFIIKRLIFCTFYNGTCIASCFSKSSFTFSCPKYSANFQKEEIPKLINVVAVLSG